MENLKQIAAEGYTKGVYVNKQRWVSYYWQTNLVCTYAPQGSVLEVGVGNNVVADYLRQTNKLTTVDIDPELRPDYLASVEDMSAIASGSVDIVLCAEVLEHLEFSKLTAIVEELKRVTKKYIIISLPYWGYTFGCTIRMPLIGSKTVKFKINGFEKHIFNGQHYWEIGKKGYSLKRVKKHIEAAGVTVTKAFWDLEDPYHYYFVLTK